MRAHPVNGLRLGRKFRALGDNMAITEAFLGWVGGWIANKAMEELLSRSVSHAREMIENTIENPKDFHWDQGDFSDAQKSLMRLLVYSRPGMLRRLLSRLNRDARGVLVVGASGSGKSNFIYRVSGKKPPVGLPSSTANETKFDYYETTRIPFRAIPGDEETQLGAWQEAADQFFLGPVPKVVCSVTAFGYLATAREDFHGYVRPSSKNEQIANNTDSYTDLCREEEIRHLEEFFQYSATRGRGLEKTRPKDVVSAFITIVNKRDLWGARYDASEVLEHYQDSSSKYAKVMDQVRANWGAPSGTTHLVMPNFTIGGGFLPDPIRTQTIALTQRAAIADALLIRATLLYYLTDGHGNFSN